MYKRQDESSGRLIRYAVAIPANSDLSDPRLLKSLEGSQNLISNDITSLSHVFMQ